MKRSKCFRADFKGSRAKYSRFCFVRKQSTEKLSVYAQGQMLPIRPNYLQRPVQAPPKFKTFKMDSRVNTGSSTNLVPTSLVTIPNFKWPADRWRYSPGNARQKFYHGVAKVTKLINSGSFDEKNDHLLKSRRCTRFDDAQVAAGYAQGRAQRKERM